MAKEHSNRSQLVKKDPYLKPFSEALQCRMERAHLREQQLTEGRCTLSDLANGHFYYGLQKTADGWVFREKAPNAVALYLYGDFSQWQIRPEFALSAIGNGDWEIQLPKETLKHGMLYKIWMVWHTGADERLPA